MKLYIPMHHHHYDDTVPAEDDPHAYLTEEAAMEVALRALNGRNVYVTAEVLEVEFDGR